MKNKKLDSKNIFISFIIAAQTLLLINLVSLYTLTHYKAIRTNKIMRFTELVGPFFRPHDRPGVRYDLGEPSVGYHFFGDLAELMFYAKNVSRTIEYLDLNIQYPASSLLFLRMFQNFEIKNFILILILFSIVLVIYGIKQYDLIVNKSLFVFTLIFLSKPFLFSIDRGNLEFVVFSLIFCGLAIKKEKRKLSLILFIFALCLKPSSALLLIFLKLPSLLLISFGFLAIQIGSYLYLKVNPIEGFLNYLNNLSSFSTTYPYPIDVEMSNLSFWTIVNNIRHSEYILLTPVGTFFQGLLNNSNLVAIVSVILYFLLIKFLKIDIYDSHIYFAGYLSITILMREFTGYYAAIYFVIPLVLLFRRNKLDIGNLIFGIFVFLSIQPVQIFISKSYLIQFENLETFYRLSSSFILLIVFLICIIHNLLDIKEVTKN
tara:strand:- start:7440 stop:8732 length:1293 start_codon:yes stop_codon:yes gene_type:complete